MLQDIRHIHFIGIGGYGMSALARVMLDLGFAVSGSDQKESAVTAGLAAEGAVIYRGHAACQVEKADLVVYSTAIPGDNAELRAAYGLNLPVWHRSELLARFVNESFGVAVAGTHGKTTTTSMIAKILTRAGLDPTAFIGGVLADFNGNARIGKSEYVVAEADESDQSFLNYRPQLAVVTNIEPDHMEHYAGDFNLLLDAYRQFLSHIRSGGCAVLSADDPHLGRMIPGLASEVITYGLKQGDYRAENVGPLGWGSRFEVSLRGEVLGDVVLKVPGLHNVQNALAAVAVGRRLNVPFAGIRESLEEFRGADRRFQFLAKEGGIAVVDDYAHHPTEVRATLAAARSNHPRRLIAIFQPHRYSRTGYFMEEFAGAFGAADKVYLHKIYSAGEAPLPGVSAEALAGLMRGRGIDAVQLNEASEIVAGVLAEAKAGDLIITMGAGDVTEMGHALAARLRAPGAPPPA